MTKLKGIKLEDLNVTKETFIKLIGLLNPDLELPDDERIIFEEEVEKCESGQVIAFYHLLVYGDNLYNFCFSFFSSDLTGSDCHVSGYNVDTCNFSMHNLLDCLYESCILTPVEEEDNPEQIPAEDAEEQSEMIDTNMGAMPIEDYHDILAYQHGFDSYEEFKKAWCSDDEEFNTSEPEQPEEEENEDCWSVECSNRTNGKVELTLGSGKNAIKKYYSSYDEMYEDNPEYKESFFNVLSINTRLTPLERTIFEAFENCSNLYVEYICKSLDVMKDEEIDEYGCYSSVVLEQVAYFHKLASIEDLKTQFLLGIISKAGLEETYQAWLAERKEQEAVGVN